MVFKFHPDQPKDILGEVYNYRWFVPGVSYKKIRGDWYVGLFQKRIRYPGGTAYFINIEVYDNSLFDAVPGSGIRYEVSIQTMYNNTQVPDVALNLTFDPRGLTVEEVENLIEDFFKRYGSDYE